ncbi:MAG: PEP-CTERM sorting domain-containing protein [Phycisphaerae bacterium]
MRNLRHAAVIVAIIGIGLAGTAGAAPIAFDTPGQSVRVDINDAKGDAGGNWNLIDSTSGGSGLIEFDNGSETTVGLGISGFTSSTQTDAYYGGNASYPGRTEAPDWATEDALEDRYFMGAGKTGSIEIDGLTPGVAYRIELASSSATATGAGNYNKAGDPPGFLKLEDSAGLVNAVNGLNGDVLTGNDTDNPDWVAWSTNVLGEEYGIEGWIVWESATPSGTSLTIDVMTDSGDSRASINAMEISVVPEPATMAMLGIGGLAALLRRRKA